MLSSQRKTQIRQKCADFRECNGLSNEEVIGDIKELIEETLGYDLQLDDLGDGFSGYSLAKSQYEYQLGFNTRFFHNEQFLRFTLAHELGHVELHKDLLRGGVMHRSKAYYAREEDVVEREADYFAISLLTPFKTFRHQIENQYPEPSVLSELANHFNVSFNATCRRFVELTDETVTLLFVDKKSFKVIYELKSHAWKVAFPREGFYQKKIPRYTFAFEEIEKGLGATQYSEASTLEDWEIIQEENWELAETVTPVEYNNQIMIFLTVL